MKMLLSSTLFLKMILYEVGLLKSIIKGHTKNVTSKRVWLDTGYMTK